MRGSAGIQGLAMALLVSGTAAAQEKAPAPTVAGAWSINVEKSDNPQEKLAQAMRQGGGPPDGGDGGFGGGGGRAGGRRGGRTGGRGGAGGQGGAEGVMDGGGQRGAGPEVMRLMGTLLRGPEKLVIAKTDSAVVLERDDLEPLSIFTDGRQVDLGSSDDRNRLTWKAEWKGDKLIVRSVIGQNLEVEESYEIKGRDPVVLQVDVKVENKAMRRTIKLKRVYDADSAGG